MDPIRIPVVFRETHIPSEMLVYQQEPLPQPSARDAREAQERQEEAEVERLVGGDHLPGKPRYIADWVRGPSSSTGHHISIPRPPTNPRADHAHSAGVGLRPAQPPPRSALKGGRQGTHAADLQTVRISQQATGGWRPGPVTRGTAKQALTSQPAPPAQQTQAQRHPLQVRFGDVSVQHFELPDPSPPKVTLKPEPTDEQQDRAALSADRGSARTGASNGMPVRAAGVPFTLSAPARTATQGGSSASPAPAPAPAQKGDEKSSSSDRFALCALDVKILQDLLKPSDFWMEGVCRPSELGMLKQHMRMLEEQNRFLTSMLIQMNENALVPLGKELNSIAGRVDHHSERLNAQRRTLEHVRAHAYYQREQVPDPSTPDPTGRVQSVYELNHPVPSKNTMPPRTVANAILLNGYTVENPGPYAVWLRPGSRGEAWLERQRAQSDDSETPSPPPPVSHGKRALRDEDEGDEDGRVEQTESNAASGSSSAPARPVKKVRFH